MHEEDAISAPSQNLNIVAAIRKIIGSVIKSVVRIRPETQGKIRIVQLTFNPVENVYNTIR